MSTAEGFEEFVAIAHHGSVTAAAESLGLPRPTLSRRLARLEERLGVRLLHRTTRKLTLTRQGEHLYARARRVVETAREAEAEVRRLDGVPRGLLRLSIPPGVPALLFGDWLTTFLKLYPEVRLEVVATSAHIDLAAEGFDLAMRRGVIRDQSLIARTIATNRLVAVASPAYLEAHGVPRTLDELTQHDCIVGFKSGTLPDLRWPLQDGGWVEVSGTFMTNQIGLRLAAAIHDHGIAVVVDREAQDALQSGAVVPVLPEIIGRRDDVNLVYLDRDFMDPKVRAFIDFLMERIAVSRASA